MQDQEKYTFEVEERDARTKVLVVKDPAGQEAARFHFMQGCPSCEVQARRRAKEFVVRHVHSVEFNRCREDATYFKTHYLTPAKATESLHSVVFPKSRDWMDRAKGDVQDMIARLKKPDR